jgi:hypothetical protein
MTTDRRARSQRRFERIDVLTRVKGRLVAIDTPIVIHDLSRGGFSLVSRTGFQPGATLDFHLTGVNGQTARVTAQAVHTRPVHTSPGLHLSGFRFVEGALTGCIPQAAIDRLIQAVTASDRSFFDVA